MSQPVMAFPAASTPPAIVASLSVELPKGGVGQVEAYNPGNTKHLAALVDLIGQQAHFHGTEFHPTDAYKARLNDHVVSGQCHANFLTVNDQPVGVITFYPGVNPHGRALYLEDIVVDNAQKGKGFASLLMQNLAYMAAQLNCSSLVWEVAHNNDPALALYRSIGTEFPADISSWRISHQQLQPMSFAASRAETAAEFAGIGRLADYEAAATNNGQGDYALGYRSYSTFNAAAGVHVSTLNVSAADPQLVETQHTPDPKLVAGALLYRLASTLSTPQQGNIDIKVPEGNIALQRTLQDIGAQPLAYAERMVIGKLGPDKTAAMAREFVSRIR